MKILFIFVSGIALVLCVAWSAKATVVLEDDFDDAVLDPAWSVSFDNATDWNFSESGSDLIVSDVIPESMEPSCAFVIMSRTFPAVTDFYANFDFSWDSESDNNDPSIWGQQEIYVRFYDDAQSLIAYAGYKDYWLMESGEQVAYAGGKKFVSGPNSLPVNGSGSIYMVREGEKVDIYWDNMLLLSNTEIRPIAEINISFKYCSDPFGLSFFGTESVDLVRVADAPLIKADFSAEPTLSSEPLTVTFSDESYGAIDTWEWNFGDGSPPSYERNPTHAYNTPERYTVSLTVIGQDGLDTETKINYIKIGDTDLIPDIKANGSDEPISITTDENLSVTVALDPVVFEGVPADWWLLADTPTGWYHYNDDTGRWAYGQSVTYQGGLFHLTPLEVIAGSDLPKGRYILYFGVDGYPNGWISNDVLYYDSVEVEVTSRQPQP
jgi:PKD repeat protein